MPELAYEIRAKGPLFDDPTIQRTFDRMITTTLRDVGLFAQRVAQAGAPHGISSGGGGLRGSIYAELRGTPGVRAEVVTSTAFYAAIVERGRAPGRTPPPTAPVLLWVQRKLGLTGPAALHAAYLIARKIGRRGTVGAYYFRHAVAQVAPYAVTQFQELGARIARQLNG